MQKFYSEFSIIEKYFNHSKVKRKDVLLGIGDDCALLKVPENQILAVTIDTLVSGVHFFENTPAYDLGYKSLAVSLSDLAAMGALPAWVTLAITLPKIDENWLNDFCTGFFDLAKEFNVELVGGNTTRGPLTITTQAHGFLPKDHALTRSGTKVGDAIYVTGTLGDSGLALEMLLNKIKVSENYREILLQKLNRPHPRVSEGLSLLKLANSAIDISDGLAADLSHILEKSQVGATIYVDDLPLSQALQNSVPMETALKLALSSGDDYELCFTSSVQDLENFTKIGIIEVEPGLRIKYKNGEDFKIGSLGYEHQWNEYANN